MPPIRSTNLLLTFDAFGTLFTPKISIAAQYVLVAQGHGLVGVKEGDVRVAFKKGNHISCTQFTCSTRHFIADNVTTLYLWSHRV